MSSCSRARRMRERALSRSRARTARARLRRWRAQCARRPGHARSLRATSACRCSMRSRHPRRPTSTCWSYRAFRLETTRSLRPAAATVLNLSEDHLDRYDGMESYARAKARIFQGDGAQVLNRDDAWSARMRLPGRHVLTFGLGAPGAAADWGIVPDSGRSFLVQGERRVMEASELGVPGLHNASNALAALALCSVLGLAESPMLRALREFRGLPHRLQPVAVCNAVTFYDDSKGTNVGATVAALSGLGKTCVLIAGGEGKGQDFTPLAPVVRDHARAVVLIGRDRDRIQAALAATDVALMSAATLEDAVAMAYAAALPGEAVLLSPACASFDMFRDYRHRGEEFARIARALAQRSGGRPLNVLSRRSAHPASRGIRPGHRRCDGRLALARAGHGLLGVDRNGRGGAPYRLPVDLLPRPACVVRRRGRGAGGSGVPGADAGLAALCARAVRVRHGAARSGADARHRTRGQRQPALVASGRAQPAAVRDR